MRIGIEAQRLLRPHKHGMDIVALETIRALTNFKEHEFIIFVKPDVDRNGLPNSPNVRFVELSGGPYPVWEQYTLPKAINQYGIDLLHCTANTAPLNCSVPLLVTLHDIIFLETQPLMAGSWYQRFGNQYRRWNVPRIVRSCERIITVSNFERQRIIDHLHLDPSRVVAIWNAVSEQFRVINDQEQIDMVRQKYKLPKEFIFFLGNTDPKKNVRGVLKSLLLLKKQGQLTLPVVISNLPASALSDILTEIGGQSLVDDIILCGYIPNYILPFIYNAATIFLCPSLRESFGLPILEAMASGTPVLTSTTSSMPEVAGNAALLVDPTSVEEMAEGINQLILKPSLRSDLRRKGLQRATLFSWEATAGKLLDVYAQAVNTPSLVA
ncbi:MULTISPECIES: glycosyltransferase family 1 protein [unclassified Spirosoma]|uniref:glycosyltransferase family 4 protein n=1 Tax=unclassified Spirosoma TaxID=2621999 RepID=UPI00095EB067|nr:MULTISPECIES: glycosyltransferase family 1 protein [unclassified Spirosoma]MBN8821451.1 glycosyltransferase family 4 protein [Spirosoma sp.]OJW78232.1 MAG: group 1 glycosyl transferase [Spirosoma sp. 48-14]